MSIPATLSWVIKCYEKALSSGYIVYHKPASRPIHNDLIISFVPSLATKNNYIKQDQKQTNPLSSTPPPNNPFEPFDQNLLITETCNEQVLLWNKFPVAPLHMLLITRMYEDQATPLERRHFAAVQYVFKRVLEYVDLETEKCIQSYYSNGEKSIRWVCFYNSGPKSGGSQPHRHVQFLPLDFDTDIKRGHLLQTEKVIEMLESSKLLHYSAPCTLFNLFQVYNELFTKMTDDLEDSTSIIPVSYNWLFDGDTFLLIPRRNEFVEIGMDNSKSLLSVNALLFAGQVVIKNENQLCTIVQSPSSQLSKLLRQVCYHK